MWGRDHVLERMVRLILLCERSVGGLPELPVVAHRLGVHKRTARRYLLAYERVTSRQVPGWRKARGV
jgi:hypothetical protein